MNELLREMYDCFASGDQIYLPSKFWELLNEKNIKQLEVGGIENIKQTVAQNYFTWVIGRRDEQFKYLLRNTKFFTWLEMICERPMTAGDLSIGWMRRFELTLFTRMLWNFVIKIDVDDLLKHISEPEAGNPFPIYFRKKLISQDLANSVLEYYSIREKFTCPVKENVTFCELGAGYGRNAYVFLNVFKNGKYIIIDIPPALFVSQEYLTKVFPGKNVFKFRCFNHFDDIRDEYEAADIVFLLPHQAKMLPNKSVDLFINISSLHEMKVPQISEYFKLIDRLTRGMFYSKQWIVSLNPEDNVTIHAADYPIPTTWHELYHRPAKVQVHFFEAIYSINP